MNVRTDDKNTLVLDHRKYYNQAHDYQTAILLALEGKIVPYFVISLSDISLSLKNELNKMDSSQLALTLRAAVLKIFQDLDDEYNVAFPENDPGSKKFRINLCKEIAKILRVKLVS